MLFTWTFSMKRDIFFWQPSVCQILRHAHALDGLFSTRLSFCLQLKMFKGSWKTTPLPIKDHTFLMLLSSVCYFIFPPKNAGCPHLDFDISHLAYIDGWTCGRSYDDVITKNKISGIENQYRWAISMIRSELFFMSRGLRKSGTLWKTELPNQSKMYLRVICSGNKNCSLRHFSRDAALSLAVIPIT